MTINRREFIEAGLVASGMAATGALNAAGVDPSEQVLVRASVSVSVNGEVRQLHVEHRMTLLDALRDHVGLIGTKKGCDRGECGACTVLVDGRRFLHRNYSGYLVPTNADIPELEVIFTDEFDSEASLLGAKGLGELTAVAVAPAIVNAVYHATGKRVRELPVTVEKLL